MNGFFAFGEGLQRLVAKEPMLYIVITYPLFNYYDNEKFMSFTCNIDYNTHTLL